VKIYKNKKSLVKKFFWRWRTWSKSVLKVLNTLRFWLKILISV